MNKIFKSVSLIFAVIMLSSQLSCSTPVASKNITTNVSNSTGSSPAKPDTQTGSQVSFLLTQKDEKGISNPIVPENIESITVNGNTYKSTDFKIIKGNNNFSVKSWSGYWTYANGKWFWTWVWTNDNKTYTISSENTLPFSVKETSGGNELNISFKLKGANSFITLPNEIFQKLGNDIRIEANKNDSGEIVGFSGGINKDGNLDQSKPVFQSDFSTNTFVILQPDGNKISYKLDDLDINLKIDSRTEEKVNNPEKQIKDLTDKVQKPSAATPFVGAWKSEVLSLKSKLVLKITGESKIEYSSTIENSLPLFKGTFLGNAGFSENSSINSLSIESTINGSAFKGKLVLSGDNFLTLTITETSASELKNLLNVPFNFQRDLS